VCVCALVTQHESGASSVLMVIRHRQRLIQLKQKGRDL